MSLRYGYVSNGFLDHSLEQMVQVLSRFGYEGIGITLDHAHLDPFHVTDRRLAAIGKLLEERSLTPVIETGARYYLDPFRKHRPSLVSVDKEGRRTRTRYYLRAIEIGAQLGASCVSLWSGTPQQGVDPEKSWDRLASGVKELCTRAEAEGMTIAFEPEPGMFVESMADYAELRERVDHSALSLTLDLGHVAITESPPFAESIVEWAPHIANVHIEDIRDREHVHLPFGEGNLDFPPLVAALRQIDYRGLVLVELSRNNADAPLQAQRSIIALRNAEAHS
ncbi:MAG: sugar phosphate isomerase/epimerase family protein [Planctomycetota bacterium]